MKLLPLWCDVVVVSASAGVWPLGLAWGAVSAAGAVQVLESISARALGPIGE